MTAYWNTWAELWQLDREISELMEKGGAEHPRMLITILLLPSGLLVSVCRTPFIPLDIYDRIRRRRFWNKQERERIDRECAELDYYRRRFGPIKEGDDEAGTDKEVEAKATPDF